MGDEDLRSDGVVWWSLVKYQSSERGKDDNRANVAAIASACRPDAGGIVERDSGYVEDRGDAGIARADAR